MTRREVSCKMKSYCQEDRLKERLHELINCPPFTLGIVSCDASIILIVRDLSSHHKTKFVSRRDQNGCCVSWL